MDVPICTEEYVLERALMVVTDGDADRLAHCLVDIPGKEAAALMSTESLGQDKLR